jgi:hypothetical protein
LASIEGGDCMISNDINYYWQNNLCPIINGIIFKDGTIKTMNPKEVSQCNYIPEYSGTKNINSKSEIEEISFTSIYKRKPVKIPELNLLVYCGEGSWGGEGFVAVCEEHEDNEVLNWIAYFDYSNPMERVEYKDKKIFAYSNLRHKWIYDAFCPENVTVEFYK